MPPREFPPDLIVGPPPEGSDAELAADNWIQVGRFKAKHGRDPTPAELDRLRHGGPLDDDDRWPT